MANYNESLNILVGLFSKHLKEETKGEELVAVIENVLIEFGAASPDIDSEEKEKLGNACIETAEELHITTLSETIRQFHNSLSAKLEALSDSSGPRF